MQNYYACRSCTAKVYSRMRLSECPRCGSTGLLVTRGVPPWLADRSPSDSSSNDSQNTKQEEMVHKSLYSSATDEWETPQWLFDALHHEFGFETDVCATADNAKCKRFYSKDDNGLIQDWSGTCWCNPPYSEIGRWLKKAYISSRHGATVICLIPARTDTAYWHNFVMQAEVRFIRGRLRFGDAANPAPFPSTVVVFRPPEFLLTTLETRTEKQPDLPGLFE